LIHASGSRERFAAERAVISNFTGGKTGDLAVHLLTPDGEPLTNKNIFRQQSSNEVLATLREALEKFGPVTPRRVKADWQDPTRGVGTRDDGSVRLALTARNTDRRDYSARPVFDSLIMTSEEWAALQPPRGVTNGRYAIPESVTKRFARGLSSNSDLSYLIRPEDLREAQLEAQVVSAQDDTLVTLSGNLQGTRPHINGGEPMRGAAKLTGQLRVDKTGKPTSLLLLFEGTFNLPYEKSPRPTAALIEWHSHASDGP